jgi:hypothetical protein
MKYLPKMCQPVRGIRRYYSIQIQFCINLKGIIMKLIATLIASAFAVTAFAAEPAKKEEVKAPVAATAPVTATKPATATAKPASTPAKADATKSVPAKAEDKKAEAPKK